MNNKELRKEMWFSFRKKAKQAVNKPPPSKLRLHHLIKQNEMASGNFEAINFSGKNPFDDNVLLYYLTEYNCTGEVKSVMKMNLPKNDIGFLWFVAIEYGINYVVAEMAKSGFNTNECYRESVGDFTSFFTALMHVVNNFHYDDYHVWMDSLQFVLDLGVDVNFRESEQGMTALLMACRDSYVAVVKLLLEHGADPEVKDDGGCNVLMCACLRNNIDVAKLWIERNVDVNDQDHFGDTALTHTVQDPQFFLHNNDQDIFDVAQLLLENGADVNISNSVGNTTLMMAINGKCDIKVLKLLLNHGANIDAQNEEDRTALMMAMRDSVDKTELLLQHGANVDIQDNEGNTVLMIACAAGEKEMVELLLNHGADKDLVNKDGNTALDLAYNSEIKDMVLNHVDTTFVLK